MADFTVRSDSVDVEQIMKQIRSRIREKRGVDYTEGEIQELARVKLDKFLDPSKVRSELLDQYRKGRSSPVPAPLIVPPAPPNYVFNDDTAYVSSRGLAGQIIRLCRRVLNPLLKLLINPNPIIHVLNLQGEINAQSSVRFDRLLEVLQDRLQRQETVRAELDALNYEVLHNLVVEVTRMSIEVKNLKMRQESLSSRLDFDERRGRALEGVVLYRPGSGPMAEMVRPAAVAPLSPTVVEPAREGDIVKGDAQRSRRRRRRRSRGPVATEPQGGSDGGHEADWSDESGTSSTPPKAEVAVEARPADAPRDPGADSTDQ